jgi:3-phenylpropionate/trans-cinnamate dioxygenase ferredoxin reductase subunit
VGVSRPGTVLVLGTGQAGFQVAASLREEGFDGRVVLVGDEPGLPYQRPPLSKAYLTGKADANAVRLRPDRFFAEHRLELRAGERAARIDRAGRRVVLASGERLPYDHLVLAWARGTGRCRCRARASTGWCSSGPSPTPRAAPAAGAAREAVVVGAGFIGLEFAAVAAARGVAVTVVEAATGRWRARSRPDVRLLPGRARAQGVRFVFGATVVRVLGDGGGARGRGDRRRPALPGRPRAGRHRRGAERGTRREAGLAVADGIAVDEHLATNDPADLRHRRLRPPPVPLRRRRDRSPEDRVGAERRGPGAVRRGPHRRPARALRGRPVVLERPGRA